MAQLILVIHILTCVGLVALVLVQHGKGADMGAAFGSGASTTVFGSQGSGSFLLKITSLLAAVFFGTSLFMGYLATKELRQTTKPALNIPTQVQQQGPSSFGLTDDDLTPAEPETLQQSLIDLDARDKQATENKEANQPNQ